MESSAEPALEQPMLKKLRNTWEFSNLMQYIYTFGKAVKIDQDLDIEVRLSALPHTYRTWQCVKSQSQSEPC